MAQNDPYLEPFSEEIVRRQKRAEYLKRELLQGSSKIADFANGHKYFGLHKSRGGWIFREWAPNAKNIFLVGEFSNWKESDKFALRKINENGVWEITLIGDAIKHLDYYKLIIHWDGGSGERIPSYANYVVQDKDTHLFSAQVWDPDRRYKFQNKSPDMENIAPIIYESHVGMAQMEGKVSTYEEFRIHTLPRIKDAGYNTVQIMAIQEHPYYGSFGYQVSNFFAPSSRFGNPEELKLLIDEAHGMGLAVIMDIVHSHAVKNELEGLGKFDGTHYQYFHDGGKGLHPAWDTMCFDYSKPQVIHFLLSNCKYWMEEFKFDGFRFDGVTSMLYHHHGLGKAFSSYGDYFGLDIDEDALMYFSLANSLIHEIKSDAISIAEDMSGMPGLAAKIQDGGYGFDYRLGMGIPDYWIKLLREQKDENWNLGNIWHELTNRRKDEKIISYAESHDQALVGDKTIIFWLLDKEMYFNMSVDRRNLVIDRGIALHKLIRFVTIATARGGYLNFMGNEFGHPEWIDFPREGNGWSYHCARRQWNLRDDNNLCYKYLAEFDKAMVQIVRDNKILLKDDPELTYIHEDDKVLAFKRGDFLFVFNFHFARSHNHYKLGVAPGEYQLIFNSDLELFGGHSRLTDGDKHFAVDSKISLYLPTRTCLVLRRS